MNGTKFMDSSRNLSSIGTVGCGAITSTDVVQGTSLVASTGGVNIPTGQTYKINNVALTYSNVGAAAASHTHDNYANVALLAKLTADDTVTSTPSTVTWGKVAGSATFNETSDYVTLPLGTYFFGGVKVNTPVASETYSIYLGDSAGTTFYGYGSAQCGDAGKPLTIPLVGYWVNSSENTNVYLWCVSTTGTPATLESDSWHSSIVITQVV